MEKQQRRLESYLDGVLKNKVCGVYKTDNHIKQIAWSTKETNTQVKIKKKMEAILE